MNAWAKLVQKTYNANKHKAGYKLRNAMKDSKKLYKSQKKRGGAEEKEDKKIKKSHNKTAKKSRKNRK
jgi:hypothetical protein